jgi:RNA polymerase sigma-70 factor (ECF subfamily)
MIRSHLRSTELAEEITQSVFVTLAEKLPAGGYTEAGRFESWLFRITMNRVRDEARRRKRHAAPTDPHALLQSEHARAPDGSNRTQHASSPPAPDSDGELAALRDALNTLGPDDRLIVEMRHVGQMSFKQIAEALDCPVGTALARHHRALKKLRAAMTNESEAPPDDR